MVESPLRGDWNLHIYEQDKRYNKTTYPDVPAALPIS
jgi:hypothetical protein